MNPSIVFAKILGPFLFLAASLILLNLKAYRKLIGEFVNNAPFVYLAGMFALTFGIVTLVFHSVWVMNWPVIITLLGWIAVLKGTYVIGFPGSLPRLALYYQHHPALLAFKLIINIVLGAVLMWGGYFG
jgi:hypothetical protein